MKTEDRYFIHPKAYWRVINFLESYCRYREGMLNNESLEGKLMKVHTWMKWQIRTIYGRYDRTTHRRAIREAYIEIPKKNNKSGYVAAFGIYHLFGDGWYTEEGEFIPESNPNVFCAAVSVAQAKIIHDLARWMVENEPKLLNIARPLQYDILRKKGGKFKVLSSDAKSQEGINSSFNAIDELHAHEDDGKLYTTLKGAGAARPQPLTINISTAGVFDTLSIGWRVHEYAEKVIADWKYDPSFHGCIYSASKDDDPFIESTWKKANPSYGTSVKKEYFESRVVEARNNPAMLNTFLRYHLNIWVSSHSEWIPSQFIDECNKESEIPDLSGKRCWIGVDLGATDDLTAIALMFHEVVNGEDRFKFLLDFFCTSNKMDVVQNNTHHITYMLWARDGWIEIAGDADTDYKFIEARIDEHLRKYNVRGMSYDPWNAFEMIQSLTKKYISKGKDFFSPVTIMPKEISPPMKKLQSMITRGECEFYQNPVLKWMIGNVLVKVDGNLNIFPNKAKAKGKIDGVMACILAVECYLNDKYKNSTPINEFFTF